MSSKTDQPAALLLNALRSVLMHVAEPSQVLKTILGQAVSEAGAERGIFVEVDRSGKFSYRVLYRYEKEQLAGERGEFSRSILTEVMRTGRIVRLANAMSDPRFTSQDSIQDLRLTSVLCLPIRIENRVAAIVHLESNASDHFREEHELLLESLLAVAGPALEALQASESIRHDLQQSREALQQSREEVEQNREFLAQEWSFGRFVGRAPAVRELARTLQNAAQTEFPALITGETGTGKSVLARVLHNTSQRSKAAFVTVFCPSLEKGMVETELFGHKRGAFTGAVADRPGKVQAADRGTLFLDEIGELPLDIQPKLLRLLQEKTYERVGDATERKADVRIVAASNRDLEEEVRAGRFRRDLYERLNFVPIRVPPLRARREDIPLLLRHLLDQNESARWVELRPEAERYLVELDYAWPGNVRNLEHLAVRMALERRAAPFGPEDLGRALDASAEGEPIRAEAPRPIDPDAGLPEMLARTEKAWIEDAMRRHPRLSRAELAAKLKIGESTLYKKMRLYGIDA